MAGQFSAVNQKIVDQTRMFRLSEGMRELVYQIAATCTKGRQLTVEVILTVPDRYDIAAMATTLHTLAIANAEAKLGRKFSEVRADGPTMR